MNAGIHYRTAVNENDYQSAKALFEEYVQSLNVDLSFQDFDKELAAISMQYSKPGGGLLLVYKDATPIGCVGIRRLDEDVAELKRMYVQPAYRGEGIGMKLLQQSLALAAQLGYTTIRLDTLANMTKAQELYRAHGFKEIPAYRFNPIQGTIYMEKDLTH